MVKLVRGFRIKRIYTRKDLAELFHPPSNSSKRIEDSSSWQCCAQQRKQDSCQVAVSLSVANDHASLPVAHRLYLPEAWAEDPVRRSKAGIPVGIGFETKTMIALGQMRRALACGVPAEVVLGDAG